MLEEQKQLVEKLCQYPFFNSPGKCPTLRFYPVAFTLPVSFLPVTFLPVTFLP